MIPKVIHYCWFGGTPLTELNRRCIASWQHYCPDYEIKRWDDNNVDLNENVYVSEAAHAKKWAFVSDYVRFKVLYEEGGLYFDTDVELIKPIDDIVEEGPFMGIEELNGISRVAPGLGLGAFPKMSLYKEILTSYDGDTFVDQDGINNLNTIVLRVTEILKKYGFTEENCIQKIFGVTIYPSDFFCPMDYQTGEIITTENTRSIHHYAMSWKSLYDIAMKKFERKCIQFGGRTVGKVIYSVLSFPIRVLHKAWVLRKKLSVKSFNVS